jgi:putative sigma-54 modulation protein
MEITIHSVHFTADQKLKDFVSAKINKLTQFSDRLLKAEVFFRLEPNAPEGNKITEIKIEMPGHELFAKKQSTTFEEAADEAVEALRKQLQKVKGKEEN